MCLLCLRQTFGCRSLRQRGVEKSVRLLGHFVVKHSQDRCDILPQRSQSATSSAKARESNMVLVGAVILPHGALIFDGDPNSDSEQCRQRLDRMKPEMKEATMRVKGFLLLRCLLLGARFCRTIERVYDLCDERRVAKMFRCFTRFRSFVAHQLRLPMPSGQSESVRFRRFQSKHKPSLIGTHRLQQLG